MGAGPAGLTAAAEMLSNTDITPIVLEKSTYMGGISRTLNNNGNRMDIGGHRFFSKSDRVMEWWLKTLPMQRMEGKDLRINYQQQSRDVKAGADLDPDKEDLVMLVRNRKSRIYFMGQFFDYPLRLSGATLKKLGLVRVAKIGMSYAKAVALPIRKVDNLEQFFINRFGRELYLTFFKEYTEKVWGVPCNEISAEWGQQRIKGLSITKTLMHLAKSKFQKSSDVAQKNVETSLIERFLYPKYGPGQMWEEVARKVEAGGGQILTQWEVTKVEANGDSVTGVVAVNKSTGEQRRFAGDYFVSTLPIKELISSLNVPVPNDVKRVSEGLLYRDFITVGLLLNKLKVIDKDNPDEKTITDNWIYIQEPGVKAGRLQIFNNWSPYMVKDPDKIWIGVEYFCYEGDALWNLSPEQMGKLAAEELDKIGIIDKKEVVDEYVFKMAKTYPAYFGTYNEFPKVREFLDGFQNLFLVGRNGMHKYNNQDHSMLTAMIAVENMANGRLDKANLWAVNTEMEYHEEKAKATEAVARPVEQTAGAPL